jgi:hypothetical protein
MEEDRHGGSARLGIGCSPDWVFVRIDSAVVGDYLQDCDPQRHWSRHRKESPLPALLVRHKVEDYAAWKLLFDEHGDTRRANGSQGGRLFRNAADPEEVLILLEWDDLDRARLFAQSDDIHETMARAGVTDQPDLWFLEEADRPVT